MFRLPLIRWQNVFDFIVLSVVVYGLLSWARKTRLLRFLLGIAGLVMAGSLASRLDLIVTAWVLHAGAVAVVVMMVVINYPEIRQALIHFDPFRRLMRFGSSDQVPDRVLITEAAFALAGIRCGALIVLTGRDSLENRLTGGVPLDSRVSREILEAIFRKVSPLHDGAAIISGNRIARAGAFLPLTRREDLPNYYGTRHRAALGLAEESDAKVIVVSEERGEVSLVEGTRIFRTGNALQLAQHLESARLRPSLPSSRKLLGGFSGNIKLKVSAVALSSLIWAVVFMTGTSVRTFTVPIEFRDVPTGLEIATPSQDMLTIQLRAASRLFDFLNENQLVATVSLKGMNSGAHRITFQADNLNLPPGVSLERTVPAALGLTLLPRLPVSAQAASGSTNATSPEGESPGTADQETFQSATPSVNPAKTGAGKSQASGAGSSGTPRKRKPVPSRSSGSQ
ncbi:MAG TPA: diadenylate cyclase [Terriglobia bacterium]|nr:diadenylate cyclase [Terriglobia bacterium]